MRRWYAVRSRARAEARAVANLERQGFPAWLPLYRKARRHAGRTETVLRPLFPRYLFVAMDLTADRWRAVLSTYGVANLLGTADGPTPVPDDLIDGLKARADSDGAFTLANARRLRPGEKIRLTGGPMESLEGIFETIDDQDRVVVLLDLLGRAVRVAVPPSDVDASG